MKRDMFETLMVMRVVAAVFVICAAFSCSTPKPPPAEPKTDWTKILREAAIAGLRALVCTDTPAPAQAPEASAPSP